MKKYIFPILCFLIINCLGCKQTDIAEDLTIPSHTEQEEEISIHNETKESEETDLSTEDPNIQSEIQLDSSYGWYKDMESFLNEWWKNEFRGAGDANIQGQESWSVLVPVLQTPDYKLIDVEVNEHNFNFYYMPVDSERLSYKDGEGFHICLHRTALYDVGMEQIYGDPEKDINVQGRNVFIRVEPGTYYSDVLILTVPHDVIAETPAEIAEYFTFEIMFCSPHTETNAVQ